MQVATTKTTTPPTHSNAVAHLVQKKTAAKENSAAEKGEEGLVSSQVVRLQSKQNIGQSENKYVPLSRAATHLPTTAPINIVKQRSINTEINRKTSKSYFSLPVAIEYNKRHEYNIWLLRKLYSISKNYPLFREAKAQKELGMWFAILVLSAQKKLFPGNIREHDGRLGSKTIKAGRARLVQKRIKAKLATWYNQFFSGIKWIAQLVGNIIQIVAGVIWGVIKGLASTLWDATLGFVWEVLKAVGYLLGSAVYGISYAAHLLFGAPTILDGAWKEVSGFFIGLWTAIINPGDALNAIWQRFVKDYEKETSLFGKVTYLTSNATEVVASVLAFWKGGKSLITKAKSAGSKVRELQKLSGKNKKIVIEATKRTSEYVLTKKQEINKSASIIKNQNSKLSRQNKLEYLGSKEGKALYKIDYNRQVNIYVKRHGSKALKGRYGEVMAGRFMNRIGYRKIGGALSNTGIDGLWVNLKGLSPKYIMAEAKYYKSKRPWVKGNPKKPGKKRQGSGGWTVDRLIDALPNSPNKKSVLLDMASQGIERRVVKWNPIKKHVEMTILGGVNRNKILSKINSAYGENQ